MKFITALTLGCVISGAPAFAESHVSGDAAAGADVFRKCKSCHMIVSTDGEEFEKGGRSGPNLYGMEGRQAGTVDDFRYGASLVEAGEAGLEWDEASFIAYVQDPKKFLAATLDDTKAKSKMSFRLKDEEDAADLWAYLVSFGPADE